MPGHGPGVAVAAEVASDFSTREVDHARERVSASYYPLVLSPIGSADGFGLRMRTITLGPLVLGRLTYDTDVHKDCGELATSYHVNVPTTGKVLSTCGDQQVISTPRVAAVFNPTGRTVLDRWTAGTTQLCLKIDREAVLGQLRDRIDRPLPSFAQFRMSMDLTSARGRTWLHALRLIAAELDAPGGLACEPLLAQEIQRLIIGGLLWSQPHSYTPDLLGPAPALRPRTVKLAMDAIDAYPDHAWTVREMSENAGVSVRALEDGFQRFVGVSPVAYLRQVRLDRVRADLVAGSPSDHQVGQVAYHWGFNHLGRFAKAYAQRFGETPSATLRYGG